MAKKKDNTLKIDLHPIEENFNEIMKEFSAFKTEQIKQYTADGQSIDMAAFESHFKTMFLFGKINMIDKALDDIAQILQTINPQTEETETQEETGEENVKETAGKSGKTGNKKGSGSKAGGRKSGEQLQLGL